VNNKDSASRPRIIVQVPAPSRSGRILRYLGTASLANIKIMLTIPVLSFKTASLARDDGSAIVTSDGELLA
jgi:hypothetical protein